jgi:hypothetical protein
MPYVSGREVFVHLAYLDDSGTKDKGSKYQVMAGVIIEGWEFRDIELAMSLAVEQLVPEKNLEKFEEFHAYELFGGYGPFEGVDQAKRIGVILALLNIVTAHHIPIVYGAVDTATLADKLYGAVDPLDVCFRVCVHGVDQWAGSLIRTPAATSSQETQDAQPLVVLICDDFQKPIKESMRKSFRRLRYKVRAPGYDSGKWHLHDDIYFGDSKESIGIQLADLCAYIIRKHLEGDALFTGYYNTIKNYIFGSQVEKCDGVIYLANANAKGQTA